jgi:hypothetical protein
MISENSTEDVLMGGYGSERGWSGKNTTASYLRLDIRRLKRKECLDPGKSLGGTGR